MKRACSFLCLALAAPAAFAQDNANSVRWADMVGVITAQNVTNPVSANIDSGTFAWSAAGGHASVDFATGSGAFDIEGLVINGTMFSGTPGPVSAVVGTLVCNAGTDGEMTFDTPQVPLSSRGNARFAGRLMSQEVAVLCGNPLFLVRIAVPEGAAGRWIATATERRIGRLVPQPQ